MKLLFFFFKCLFLKSTKRNINGTEIIKFSTIPIPTCIHVQLLVSEAQ